ncbi:2OG-Fe(II) oxygenase [Povalibacter sp.]|uniref:2OG-Fe(II) oxygenase n=1 Tax=Povalibacter sp. TaxID=1962978 RepID=UPI002F410DEA
MNAWIAQPDQNAPAASLVQRIESCDWLHVAAQLDEQGFAVLSGLLSAGECDALRHGYAADAGFRKRVVMARHGFGRGEYQYFDYPLPSLIQSLRHSIYPHLTAVANRWCDQMNLAHRFPDDHESFLERCHAAGQTQATPLLLRYESGDYNCLHQDLYGEHVFPLQLAALLSQPGRDFTGGEFVITEQRPRMQSRASVVPLEQGDAVVFAVHHRPIRGTRGFYRVNLRHGVSPLRSGRRFTAGIIFHDAQK